MITFATLRASTESTQLAARLRLLPNRTTKIEQFNKVDRTPLHLRAEYARRQGGRQPRIMFDSEDE